MQVGIPDQLRLYGEVEDRGDGTCRRSGTVSGRDFDAGGETAEEELPVSLPNGGYVPLGDLVNIAFAPSPNVIKRDGGSRRIDVVGNVAGRDLASVANEVRA